MIGIRAWMARIREFVSGAPAEQDLNDELRLHQELLAAQYEREGMTAEAARRRAVHTLGSLDAGKELVRDASGLPVLDHLRRDVTHAVRVLVKAPAFSVVTILTLALGIGVNVAIFSIVDAVVLRPLPYPDANRLIAIWETNDGERLVVAPGNLADYRSAQSFDAVAGLASPTRNLTDIEAPEALLAEEVTDNYFAVLGVHPAIGRAFRHEDTQDTSANVVIISDALWRRRFGRDPGILGRSIVLDGEPHEVVGVMAPEFRGFYDLISPDRRSLWLPARYPADVLANRADHEIRVVARLADGASVPRAAAELTAISERLALEFPSTNGKVRAVMQPLRDDVVRNVRTSLITLLLTVAAILTIACVNVANLFLARGVGRRREMALRFALGATRGRVVTTLVAESLVLAAAAGIIGVLVATWAGSVLTAAAPQDIPRLETVGLDMRVLAYTAGVALVTGLLFAVIPAWQAGHARPLDAIAGSGRVIAGRTVMRWRNTLMLAQIALSALLLVGAGLMVKSLARLNSVPLGFNPSAVTAMRLTLPEGRYPNGNARLQFFQRLEEQLAGVPGIEAVGYANNLPLRGGWGSGFQIEGLALPASGFFTADFQAVSAGYFRTLGIRLAEGRLLTDADHDRAQPVAVVSRMFERRFLDGNSALGRQIRRGPKMPSITIVGVVDDVRRDGRQSELNAQVYLSAAQTSVYPVRLADLAVRSSLPMVELMPRVRAAVSSIDPTQAISSVRALDDILLANAASQRFQALLFSMFAVLALVLASVGTYGVVSYVVSQRTPEIGVRLALGAGAWDVYRWLLGRTALLLVAGVIIGLAAARALGRYVTSLLFEVTVSDPPAYVFAASVLLTVALIASVLAGHRAIRINPTSALRTE